MATEETMDERLGRIRRFLKQEYEGISQEQIVALMTDLRHYCNRMPHIYWEYCVQASANREKVENRRILEELKNGN